MKRPLILSATLFAAMLSMASAAVDISVNFAPPVIPVVEQPPCPVDGYLWTPGYWAYSDVGYYWTPGIWVPPPQVGFLWTPPWWGWGNGVYIFHNGYWGPHVGFYGGINYGFGYFGSGYYGGRWEGNAFRYNTAITRVNTTIVKNVYVDKTVVRQQNNATRASFNGPNGVKAQPTAEEKAAEQGRRIPPTAQQTAKQEAASKNRDLQASVNGGHPKPEAINAVRGEPGTGANKEKAGKPENATREKAGRAAANENMNARERGREQAAAREREREQATARDRAQGHAASNRENQARTRESAEHRQQMERRQQATAQRQQQEANAQRQQGQRREEEQPQRKRKKQGQNDDGQR